MSQLQGCEAAETPQAAGWSICAMQALRSASEASMGEMCPNSSHQRGSSDDAQPAAGITEMSVVTLSRLGACAEADVHAEKKDVCSSTLHPVRRLPHGFGSVVYSFPYQGMLHSRNQHVDVGAMCLEELCPGRLGQQVPAFEATPHSSKAQAVASSSHTSKLSSFCFLEERGLQVTQSFKDCHWAVCSSLLRPLAMGDICSPPLISIPSELSCLQINLDGNRELLHLDRYKGSVCIDHVSIDWPILRKWLQTLNGRCVPGLIQGKKFPNWERGITKVSTSQPINDSNDIISSYGTPEDTKSCIAAQQSLLDVSGFQVKNGDVYVENGGSGLDGSKYMGSACCSSDDECDTAYNFSTEFTTASNDGLDCSDMPCGSQGHRDDDCCYYYKCCLSTDDTENIYGSFVYPAMDKDDSFYECSAHCCNVGYVGPICGVDTAGVCSMDYFADESGYPNCGGNIDVSGAVYGDVLRIQEYGAYESPVEIHAVNSHTWWDRDAVLLDVKEAEEEKIEEEWQVV